jgi:hypothetical protein
MFELMMKALLVVATISCVFMLVAATIGVCMIVKKDFFSDKE